jgi:multidrug efflux pump subunit AcrA (membrane-fusion protein)
VARDVPTVEVERSAFVRLVRAEGTLQAVQATPIMPPPGTERPLKIAWLAEDGARVEEGEVVIRFDATEMERSLANSKDDVASSRHQMTKVNLERDATRRKRDAAADLAEFEAKVAKEFESDDTTIFSRAEIAESAIDLELAHAKAGHARDVKAIEGKVSKSELELHRISQDQAGREVKRAEDGLGNLEVKAPHPGILVLERDWKGETVKVGDQVWRGMKLAELPLVAELEAKLFVLEADAGAIAEGVPAELVVDAHPDVTHVGKVKQVDTLAQPRHPEVNYFGVTVALDETDGETMRVGQRVQATLRIEAPDAIVVPRQSIFDRDGKVVVYRKSAVGFEPVEVEVGVASAGRVVIESGIEPGDEVALRDPTKDADELLSTPPEEKAAGDAKKEAEG